MFCKACGQPINDNQAICLNCGVKAGDGNSYCANCGNPVNPNASVCLSCGVAIAKGKEDKKNWLPAGKDKMMAIVLCLFLGGVGVHNFYLGETKKGIIKILLCLFVISEVLALVDLLKMITDNYVVDPNKAF